MEEVLGRFFQDLIDRVSGPMKFRLVLQPLMAIIFGVRAGLKDAKEGKLPYNWALISDTGHRRELLRSGWRSVGKLFVMAILIDLIYQWIVFRRFYPVEALLVAAILAFIPYLLIRGPLTRIVRRKNKGKLGKQ